MAERSYNDPGYINDTGKWVWQHETTTARDATGLDEPPVEGCDFPPLSGNDPKSYRVGPDECFWKQKDWVALLKQQEEVAQCKDASCFIRPENLLPWLGNTVAGLIKDLIASNLPGGAIAEKLLDSFLRADKSSFSRGYVRPVIGWLTSEAMKGLMNALEDAGEKGLGELFGPSARKQMIEKFKKIGFVDTYRKVNKDCGLTEDTDKNLMRWNQKLIEKKLRFDAILYRARPTGWLVNKSKVVGKDLEYLNAEDSQWFYDNVSEAHKFGGVSKLKGVKHNADGKMLIPINASDHFGVVTDFKLSKRMNRKTSKVSASKKKGKTYKK
jgi:hypothetical protein